MALLARRPHQFLKPPTAAFGALFSDAVGRAQSDLAFGRSDSARLRLRGLTGLCLGCHSRHVSTASLALPVTAGLPLDPLECGQFLAATRQFDAALVQWASVLAEPAQTEADAFTQVHALRSSLSVLVRAKDDSLATAALLLRQSERAEQPEYIRRTIHCQLADAQAWAAEKLVANRASSETLFRRASELIEAAGAADRVLPREEERIKVLRAAAYFSLALERDPAAKWRGEALYRLGLATAAARDPDLWDLDGRYFEACIRENQHTLLAQKCINRLSHQTLLGYTGSGGTRVPADVTQRLTTLRALAAP